MEANGQNESALPEKDVFRIGEVSRCGDEERASVLLPRKGVDP